MPSNHIRSYHIGRAIGGGGGPPPDPPFVNWRPGEHETIPIGVSNVVDKFGAEVAIAVTTLVIIELHVSHDAVPVAVTPSADYGVPTTVPVAVASVVDKFIPDLSASAAVAVKIDIRDEFVLDGTWICPAGVTSVKVECWGGGGSGNNAFGALGGSGGGGGGAYSRLDAFTVTPGNSYAVTVGQGGVPPANPGTDSWFSTAGTVLAKGGLHGDISGGLNQGAGGAGGAAASGIGDTKFSGGNGGGGTASPNPDALRGGGGGGGAGDANNGSAGTGSGNGGNGGAVGGGSGGTGAVGTTAGTAGSIRGGGGGGGSTTFNGGFSGARGAVRISYTLV